MTQHDSNIKLIALDMDGTLLNEDLEVSSENKEAVKKAQDKGVEVVICTGRSLPAAQKFVEELKLTSYLVTGNGSEIWHASGKLVERTPLETELVELMLNLKQKHNVHHWAAAVDKVWQNDMPENISEAKWLKFGFDIKDDHVRETIFDLLMNHDGLEVTNSSLTNIEVNAAGVNKAAALSKLCDRLGFGMENVMAVGDSLNDKAMITEAGKGVAMGNAQEAVKDAADWITSANNDHGVAEAVKKFVL